MSVQDRIAGLDWEALGASLWERGYARIAQFLDPAECAALQSLYAQGENFRSRVMMERYRFGRGEYQYFRYPLPPLVADLRKHAYAALVPTANAFAKALRFDQAFPAAHTQFVSECAAAGQLRPTPLMLKYGPGDYNCLHQDLYGPLVFPFQLTCFLSQAGSDYQGGEFILLENRPRAQSLARVVSVDRGDIVVFATRFRPMQTKSGYTRAALRHGVSELHGGSRYALGIIFHDAS